MMGRALGIPDSGPLVQHESAQSVDPNEPLDKLFTNRRFRQSFMEFADRSITYADDSSLFIGYSSIPRLMILNSSSYLSMQLFGWGKCPFLRGAATA